MLISLNELINKYNINFKGILHVGAHECEELNDYEKYISRDKILWVEAMCDKVEICKEKYPGVNIEKAVISDKIETITFNISNNGQSSSFLDFGLHKIHHPDINFVKSIEMETKLLKDIICNYDIDFNFINLDIQGTELRALKSMEKYLNKIDYIYTEVNSDYVYKDCNLITEMDDYLKKFSFVRVETSWAGQTHWGDAFYIRQVENKNTLKIFFNGWFSGFFDKTNPGLHVEFFIELFKKLYDTNIEIGTIENSEILCEFDMLIDTETCVKSKTWKHTFLFSGEASLQCNKKDYSCVLWGEKNHDNVINVPLFIPYIYTNNFVNKLENLEETSNYPEKDVCVIISNSNGPIRNKFLEKLENYIKIDYLGNYKNNNTDVLNINYNSLDFINYISQYKFIISMENNREETYITEKIIHGLLGKNIPVYWGSQNIHDYINNERILTLLDDNSDEEMDNVIKKILQLKNNKTEWLNIVNKNVFPNGKLERTIDRIVCDIQNLLFDRPYNLINKICIISSPVFESDNYERLNVMFSNLGLESYNLEFICPTYKQTISPDIINKYVTNDLMKNSWRNCRMKKAEISLFINYKSTLEYIHKNYSDGLFLIFESDVLVKYDKINDLNNFINDMYQKQNDWDLIHIGGDLDDSYQNYIAKPYCESDMPYRNYSYLSHLPQEFIKETFSEETQKYRLVRKFHTRCLDSFLWNYSGICKFLKYMNENPNYNIPLDYYMVQYLENNTDFKHYWSFDTFFLQGSNHGFIPSSIQNDTD